MRTGLAMLPLLLLVAGAAPAQTLSDRFAGPVEPADRKVYDETRLDPAELKTCVQLDLDLQRLAAELAALNEGLEHKRAAIKAMGDEVDRLWTLTDQADATEARIYHDKVAARRDAIEEFNGKLLPAYNDRRSLLADTNGKFAALCADKSFYTDDLAAAKQALGLAEAKGEGQ